MVYMLNTVLAPVFLFQSWVMGCHCHEALVLETSVAVDCIWKGCRGLELSGKLAEVARDVARAASAFCTGADPEGVYCCWRVSIDV